MLSSIEDQEIAEPSQRKQAGDTWTYTSHCMLAGVGLFTICDLGTARIGPKQNTSAMPVAYRAPEVILKMTWGIEVDLWALGLLVC